MLALAFWSSCAKAAGLAASAATASASPVFLMVLFMVFPLSLLVVPLLDEGSLASYGPPWMDSPSWFPVAFPAPAT